MVTNQLPEMLSPLFLGCVCIWKIFCSFTYPLCNSTYCSPATHWTGNIKRLLEDFLWLWFSKRLVAVNQQRAPPTLKPAPTPSTAVECVFSFLQVREARWRRDLQSAVWLRVSWSVLLCVPSLQVQPCAAVFLLHCRGLHRLLLTTLDWFPRQPGCLHMESNQLPQMRAFVSTVTITRKERERGREKEEETERDGKAQGNSYPYFIYISSEDINCYLSNRVAKSSQW